MKKQKKDDLYNNLNTEIEEEEDFFPEVHGRTKSGSNGGVDWLATIFVLVALLFIVLLLWV